MDRERPEGDRHPVPRRALTRCRIAVTTAPGCREGGSPTWVDPYRHKRQHDRPPQVRERRLARCHHHRHRRRGQRQHQTGGKHGDHIRRGSPRGRRQVTPRTGRHRGLPHQAISFTGHTLRPDRSGNVTASAESGCGAASHPQRMANRTWLPRTADRVMGGVARGAGACSLGGEEKPRRPRRGFSEPLARRSPA